MAGRFSLGDVRSASFDSQTSTTLVAAPGAGKSVVVVGLVLSGDAGATTVTIDDGTNDLFTALNTAQLVLPLSDLGWFEGGANAALSLTAAAAVTGHVRYVVVDA